LVPEGRRIFGELSVEENLRLGLSARRRRNGSDPLAAAYELFPMLADIRDRGVSILLVEQRAQRTVALADRTYVLANGELRMTLTQADADDTDKMIAAYLA